MPILRTLATLGLVTAALTWGASRLCAQDCQDDAGVADSQVKTAADMANIVKSESQQDFENKFHQKSSLNKLTFALSSVGGVLDCLDKATADPASAALKAKYTDLRDRITKYRTSLKSADDPKAAKALIATFDLSTASANAPAK